MHAGTVVPTRPFRALERALIVRRIASLDALLRVELAALALLVAGFVFWQTRIPLAGAALAGGPALAARALALRLAALAAAGVALAGAHHAWILRVGPPGPPWLALPVPPASIRRHLAWNSSLHAAWSAVPAAGCLVAGAGIVPAAWLALMAAAFALVLGLGARLACALVWEAAWRRGESTGREGERRESTGRKGAAGLDPLVAVLAHGSAGREQAGRAARVPAATWRARTPLATLLHKDLAVSARPGAARRRLAVVPLGAALALAVWFLPVEPRLAQIAGFALSLLTAALLGEWILALSGADPFQAFRSLPIGPALAWGSRAAWAGLGAAALVTLQLGAARVLAPPALGVHLVWLGLAALAIGLLAANYAVTLHPRAAEAQRLFSLTLGLAVAASIMIPLMGWIVLLTAVLHSLRRVPRWSRPEAA